MALEQEKAPKMASHGGVNPCSCWTRQKKKALKKAPAASRHMLVSKTMRVSMKPDTRLAWLKFRDERRLGTGLGLDCGMEFCARV